MICHDKKVLTIKPLEGRFIIELRENGRTLFEDSVDILKMDLESGRNYWAREYLGADYHAGGRRQPFAKRFQVEPSRSSPE